MNMRKFLVLSGFTFLAIFIIFVIPVFAVSADFIAKATEFYQRRCIRNPDRISREASMLCYLFDKASELDTAINNVEQEQTNQATLLGNLQTNVASNSADITALKGRKSIFDYAQVRGANWETSTINTPIETPDHITVNCPEACILWVNFDVDTRNTNGTNPGWPQHLYHIYVDGVNQAIFNQVSMIVANAAIPLAVNGVIPVSAGQHTVTIYALTTGGTLQQFESHLQVLAIKQ